MAKSMTGYGRCEAVSPSRKITVEMKSVNHRYLDLNIKLPRKLFFLESDIRNRLKQSVSRGKVDVYVTVEQIRDENYALKYHPEIARAYMESISAMAEEFHLENDLSVTELSHYPDVLEVLETQDDEEELWADVSKALEGAIAQFVENRMREGQRLADDLQDKMQEMSGYVQILEQRSPEIIEEYKNRILRRISELLEDGQVDESRIAAEVTIYADKVCIDEEVVRLKSHVEETMAALAGADEIGRRLDFIAQEMNREANTILSKSTDAKIAAMGIALKTLIEKVREQIQNIE